MITPPLRRLLAVPATLALIVGALVFSALPAHAAPNVVANPATISVANFHRDRCPADR